MKFEEALKAMREGKKVRRRSWHSYEYMYYEYCNKSLVFCNMFKAELKTIDILADDWEIYEEKPKETTKQLAINAIGDVLRKNDIVISNIMYTEIFQDNSKINVELKLIPKINQEWLFK